MCLEFIIIVVKPSYSITITLAQRDAQKSNTNTAKIGEKNIGALKMRNNIWFTIKLFFFQYYDSYNDPLNLANAKVVVLNLFI